MTTDTKSDAKIDNLTKPMPKGPQTDASTSKRDGIPVAMLKFHDQYPIEIPGTTKTALTGMHHHQVINEKGERIYMGACWVIDFLPAMRHHRVVFFSPDPKPPQVRMIHESHVRTWEPLAL